MTELLFKEAPVWERNMNPEQLATIRHTRGPCLVMAVAGAGKTRALVHRVARMVAEGVNSKRILAVTFSKAAADEMNRRLDKLGVKEARIGTWHSLCLQILREDGTYWGKWRIDDNGARFPVLIKEALGYKNLNWATNPKDVAKFIGMCKANLEFPGTPEAMERARLLLRKGEFRNIAELELPNLCEAYVVAQRMVQAEGLLTFDDFLMFAYQHLASSEEVRTRWAGRWDYVLQDEFQDTNRAQAAIAFLLAKDHRNYMPVGDPSQAIYSFRGSTPAFIRNFEEEWNAEVVIMNRNYRSGSKIIEAANTIIGPAEGRLDEPMIAERGVEGAVSLRGFKSEKDEARDLACWVEQRTKAEGVKPNNIAVLYRLNAQSRAAEEALLRARIPYRILGGVSFYERREVKNLLSYLRVAIGWGDEDDLRKCINAPFRFLGRAFVDRVLEKADEIRLEESVRVEAALQRKRLNPESDEEIGARPVDWTRAVLEVSEEDRIQARQQRSAEEWASIVNRISQWHTSDKEDAERGLKPDSNVASVLHWLINKTKYLEWLKREDGEGDNENDHTGNVEELLRVAADFKTIDGLLSYIGEMNDKKKNNSKKDDVPHVVLMSVHRSKGLEFPHVWVYQANESKFPFKFGDPQEERRLAYVAITRAMDELVISYSESAPSVFVEELQPETEENQES